MSFKSIDILASPVVDVDVGEDNWRRCLTFVTSREHLALRLVKSVLPLSKPSKFKFLASKSKSWTHRGWFKRVRPTKHRVPCWNQLLEISLQRVQTWAVVEGLRKWNVSRKVSENWLLLVDWLRLAPVVVNVRLERSWLDAAKVVHINWQPTQI